MKSLIAILSVAIILLCLGTALSAQETKDDKKWEISSYFGAGQGFAVPCFGLGLQYFLTPRISVEGEINYLPHIAYAPFPYHERPQDEAGLIMSKEDERYRLLWDINFLFYFDITKVKRPAMRWFLTVGTGYQYDRVEYTIAYPTTTKRHKYGIGHFWFQRFIFGAGLKVNIKDSLSLGVLYKIHMAYIDLLTARLALALSFRF